MIRSGLYIYFKNQRPTHKRAKTFNNLQKVFGLLNITEEMTPSTTKNTNETFVVAVLPNLGIRNSVKRNAIEDDNDNDNENHSAADQKGRLSSTPDFDLIDVDSYLSNNDDVDDSNDDDNDKDKYIYQEFNMKQIKRELKQNDTSLFCDHVMKVTDTTSKSYLPDIIDYRAQTICAGHKSTLYKVQNVHYPNNVRGDNPRREEVNPFHNDYNTQESIMNFYNYTEYVNNASSEMRRWIYDQAESNNNIFDREISKFAKASCAIGLNIPKEKAHLFTGYVGQMLAMYRWRYGELRLMNERKYFAKESSPRIQDEGQTLETLEEYICALRENVLSQYHLVIDRSYIDPVSEMLTKKVPYRSLSVEIK